jgi:hypothetical protein
MSDFAEMRKSARVLPTLTLPGSRTFAFWYAVGSSALIALGIVTLPSNPFLIAGGAAAFIAVFVMAVVTVTPGSTSLTVDPEGLTRCLMFRTVRIDWQDVAAIRSDWFISATFPVAWNRQVILPSRHRGADGLSFFPYQFGYSAEQMIRLLMPYLANARRQSALAGQALAA